MAAAGAEVVKHYRELAFMGFTQAIMNLRTILRNIEACKRDIEAYKPDARSRSITPVSTCAWPNGRMAGAFPCTTT